MGVRDRIRSQLWYNSVGGGQIEIWWVFETGSEVHCGKITWVVPKSRHDDRQQYTWGSHPTEKSEKRQYKKATSWLTMIVHLGIDLCCATIWEYAVGDKDKRSTNGHVMYAITHPSLYLIQIVTEWGIFSKTNFVRQRLIFIWFCAPALDIYCQIHPLVCVVPTTFTAVVLKSQVSNDLKSKHKTWERPPIKRWESGLLRLYIAPVSTYLRWWYLQRTEYTEDKLERVNTQDNKRLQFKWWTWNTITTTKITQGTADGHKNVVARILAWQYAEDIDKLARTQDTYSFRLR